MTNVVLYSIVLCTLVQVSKFHHVVIKGHPVCAALRDGIRVLPRMHRVQGALVCCAVATEHQVKPKPISATDWPQLKTSAQEVALGIETSAFKICCDFNFTLTRYVT
jgi:hypothetical protein